MKKCVEESRMYLLLQAAKPVIVRSEDVENSVTVGIVFDSCRQRSYISNSLKETTKLAATGREPLLVKTFGENYAQLCECEVVQFGIKTSGGEVVYVRAFTVFLYVIN